MPVRKSCLTPISTRVALWLSGTEDTRLVSSGPEPLLHYGVSGVNHAGAELHSHSSFPVARISQEVALHRYRAVQSSIKAEQAAL